MSKELLVERDGAVATLVFNRPEKRNALSYEMYREIPVIVSQVADDEAVRVLILRGAGTSAFAAGADISEFKTLRNNAQGARVYNEAVAAAEHAIENLAIPVIAMIHGFCIGGGCGLALACDIRLADTAARLGITPAKLGLVYSLESTKRLVDLVGPDEAKFILFSGRQVGADRALRTGLVHELHDPMSLQAVTRELADEVATRAPISVARTKEIVALITRGQVADDTHSTDLRNSSFDTRDYAEGVQAFLDKRRPQFEGH